MRHGPSPVETTRGRSVPTGQQNDAQLRLAIASKRLIRFRYKGSSRVAEPHDYGVQNGTVKLLAYQLRGPVRAPGKSAVGFRLFDVSGIEECAVLEKPFPGSRGRFHLNHLAWDVIYTRVT